MSLASTSGAARAIKAWTFFIKVCMNSSKKLLFSTATQAEVRAVAGLKLQAGYLMVGFSWQTKGIVESGE